MDKEVLSMRFHLLTPPGVLSPLWIILAFQLLGCASINPLKKPTDPEVLLEAERSYGYSEKKGIFSRNSKTSLRTNIRTLMGKGINRDAAREIFAEADALYREAAQHTAPEDRAKRRRKFVRASEQYREAGLRWPNSAMEENALFMEADALFFADHYDDANEKFEELLKRYPNSRHLDRAEARRFAVAQYWEKLNDDDPEPFYYFNLTGEERPVRDAKGNALRIYDRIRIDDPTGALADDATMAAANLQFQQGKYIQADEYYTDLRRTFPSSEHQFMAHFLGLRAKLASYQGVDYSGTVLNQADKLIETMQMQFPDESRKHQEYLAKAAAEVAFLQAERDWTDGKYYDRRDEFGAAKFHYAKLLKEYPNTPFAQKARERIGEIYDQPDVPDQKLEWLVDLFPSDAGPPLQPIQEGTETSVDPTVVAQGNNSSSR